MISLYFFIYLFTTTSTREFELLENRGIKSISCLENKSQYMYIKQRTDVVPGRIIMVMMMMMMIRYRPTNRAKYLY